MFESYKNPSRGATIDDWKEAVFVLDANVLLNLYGYPSDVADEFLDLLVGLCDQLWFPHHVGIEFFRNRPQEIRDQRGRCIAVRNAAAKLGSELDGVLHQTAVEPTVQGIVTEFVDKLEQALADYEARAPTVSGDDHLLRRLETIFDGKFGDPPNSDWVRDLNDEGKARYAARRPPGYEDLRKKGDARPFTALGVRYEPVYGDLIIWKQLLEHFAPAPPRVLIFVTDDSTEDWWWFVNGERVGVRPELYDEVSAAGIASFFMYSSSEFLETARRLEVQDVANETVQSVRELARGDRSEAAGNGEAQRSTAAAIAAALEADRLSGYEGIQTHLDMGRGSTLLDLLRAGEVGRTQLDGLMSSLRPFVLSDIGRGAEFAARPFVLSDIGRGAEFAARPFVLSDIGRGAEFAARPSVLSDIGRGAEFAARPSVLSDIGRGAEFAARPSVLSDIGRGAEFAARPSVLDPTRRTPVPPNLNPDEGTEARPASAAAGDSRDEANDSNHSSDDPAPDESFSGRREPTAD